MVSQALLVLSKESRETGLTRKQILRLRTQVYYPGSDVLTVAHCPGSEFLSEANKSVHLSTDFLD